MKYKVIINESRLKHLLSLWTNSNKLMKFSNFKYAYVHYYLLLEKSLNEVGVYLHWVPAKISKDTDINLALSLIRARMHHLVDVYTIDEDSVEVLAGWSKSIQRTLEEQLARLSTNKYKRHGGYKLSSNDFKYLRNNLGELLELGVISIEPWMDNDCICE